MGVSIALVAEASDWLYALFTFKSFWTRVRIFLYWLPPNITLAFAGGFLADMLQSKENQLGVGLVALGCFSVSVGIAYVLERNGFILRDVWREWDEHRLRANGKLLYSAGLMCSLVPYVFFWRQSSILHYALISFALIVTLELVFYNRVWNFLHASEGDAVRRRVEVLVQALCHRCVGECPFFLDDEPDVFGLLTHTRDELEGSLKATNDLLFQIMRFSPLDRQARPLPGLTEGVLPTKRVKAIAREVQTELLARLDIGQKMVHLLIGSGPEATEALTLLSGKIDSDLVERLKRRRNQLDV